MDFLDRCAEADPETAALMMALYNEGVRRGSSSLSAEEYDGGHHWYEMETTGPFM